MGGTSSTPVASPSDPSAEEEGAFFTLSESIQEQMALEFQNEQVVKMFGKQMEKIGKQKEASYKKALEQKAILERKLQDFKEQNEQVQTQLDARIEKLEDTFTDASNVVEYDMSRLEKVYLKSLGKTNVSKIPCFVEQIDIATCLRNKTKNETTKDDPFACDVFLKALNDCTHQEITAKQ